MRVSLPLRAFYCLAGRTISKIGSQRSGHPAPGRARGLAEDAIEGRATIDLCMAYRYTARRAGQPVLLPGRLIRPATGRPHRL